MKIEISDKAVKVHHNKFLIYDIDYLLEHLDDEIKLLRSLKEFKEKKQRGEINYDMSQVPKANEMR